MIPILATVLLTWALCMPLHFYGKNRKQGAVPDLSRPCRPSWPQPSPDTEPLCLPGSDDYARLIFLGLCTCVFADVLLEIRFEVGGFLFFWDTCCTCWPCPATGC